MSQRGRAAARILALVIAGAASIATSASPTPPPAVIDAASGVLLLTAAAPIASVDITVSANAALRAAQSGRTLVSISGRSADTVPVVGRIVDLDDPASFSSATFASRPLVSPEFDDTCPVTGDCTRRFRITAALVDPSSDGTTFQWSVEAATHLPAQGGTPPPAPPGSRLEVNAAAPVPVSAASLSAAATQREWVVLSADRPFASREVVARLPAAPVGSVTAGLLLSTRVDDPDGEGSQPRAVAQVYDVTDGDRDADRRPADLTRAFADCALEGPCERRYRVELVWKGGPAGPESVVDWSLAAWTVADADGGAPPIELSTGGALSIDADAARLTAETSGAFDVDRWEGPDRVVTLTLDASELEQAAGPIRGLARLRVHAASAADSTGTIRLSVGPDAGERVTATLQPGQATVLTSGVVAVDCHGRARCPVTFYLEPAANENEGHRGRVDWRLVGELIPLDADAPFDQVTLRLDVTDPG